MNFSCFDTLSVEYLDFNFQHAAALNICNADSSSLLSKGRLFMFCFLFCDEKGI